MSSIHDIQRAAQTIAPFVLKTPLVFSATISRIVGAEVYLKLENLQRTGSFKVRGAVNKIIGRRDEIGPDGVVAASAGNHAQGVALAAGMAGFPAAIVMPEWTSLSKQEATRAYGGTLVIQGTNVTESLEKAKALADAGPLLIHPYDDPDIIAGQGTIALEIMADLPDVEMVIAPVGGGGLIAGIAEACKALNPAVDVVGAQAAACPGAYEAISKGKISAVKASQTVAEGIRVKRIGVLPFEIIRKHVREIALATEEEIVTAMLMLLERKKILSEGAGAVPLAVLLNGSVKVSDRKKIVLVVSGGNLDSPLLGRIIRQGLSKSGRVMRLKVTIADKPGALASLLKRIAELQANVLHIRHDRYFRGASLHVSSVDLELETRGHEHGKELLDKLKKSGYIVDWE